MMAVDLSEHKDLLVAGGAVASILALAVLFKPKASSTTDTTAQPDYHNQGVIYVPEKGPTYINYNETFSTVNSNNTTTTTTNTPAPVATIPAPVAPTSHPTPTPAPQPVSQLPGPIPGKPYQPIYTQGTTQQAIATAVSNPGSPVHIVNQQGQQTGYEIAKAGADGKLHVASNYDAGVNAAHGQWLNHTWYDGTYDTGGVFHTTNAAQQSGYNNLVYGHA